jgi:hypothetical protein
MSLNSHVFPYGIKFQAGGRVELFPAAKITLSNKEEERLSLFLLIDSGATISALPKGAADALGIDVKQGDQIHIFGIGGQEIQGWRHLIPALFEGGETFILPIVFLDDNIPYILGRDGVFDQFTIIFDESKRRSGFVGKRAQENNAIQKVLDEISA